MVLTMISLVSTAMTGALSHAAAQAPPDPLGRAAVVVGNPATLTPADSAVIGWIQQLGWETVVVDDDAPEVDDPLVFSVVIMPSTASASIGTKYRTTHNNMVVFASASWDELELSDTQGTFSQSTTLEILQPTHFIADGVPDPVQIVTQARYMRAMSVPDLAPGASAIAERQDIAGENVVFTIPAGGELADGTFARGNRAVVGFAEATLANITSDGRHLVENAILWSFEGSYYEPPGFASFAATALTASCSGMACWEMNEDPPIPVTTRTMLDTSAAPAFTTDWTFTSATSNTKKRVLYATERSVGNLPQRYWFYGWSRTGYLETGPLGPTLDATNPAALAAGESQILAADPTGTLNPKNGNFSVRTAIIPRLVKVNGVKQLPEPAASGANSDPTYNLVQKGFGNEDQWKIALDGTGTDKGTITCTYIDYSQNTAGVTARSQVGGKTFKVDESLWNSDTSIFVTCELDRTANVVRLKVGWTPPPTPTQPLPQATSFVWTTALNGKIVSVDPGLASNTKAESDYVAIGRKPRLVTGSNGSAVYPADAYSGWIGYVRIFNTLAA